MLKYVLLLRTCSMMYHPPSSIRWWHDTTMMKSQIDYRCDLHPAQSLLLAIDLEFVKAEWTGNALACCLLVNWKVVVSSSSSTAAALALVGKLFSTETMSVLWFDAVLWAIKKAVYLLTRNLAELKSDEVSVSAIALLLKVPTVHLLRSWMSVCRSVCRSAVP